MSYALITGGTSGIGAAFARALAVRGWNIVLVARDVSRLETTAEALRAHGRAVEVIEADLADRASVARVVQRLEASEKPIDMLVNNAGFGVEAPITLADTTAHERAIDVMLTAVFVLSSAAGRAMSHRGHGYIVNISSAATYLTSGSYSAIKAFVTTLSEGLSGELHGTGVRVTAVLPGYVRTEFHERANIRVARIPQAMWLDADALVADALRDVAQGRVISIPSWRYRILMGLARKLPRSIIRRISREISQQYRD